MCYLRILAFCLYGVFILGDQQATPQESILSCIYSNELLFSNLISFVNVIRNRGIYLVLLIKFLHVSRENSLMELFSILASKEKIPLNLS